MKQLIATKVKLLAQLSGQVSNWDRYDTNHDRVESHKTDIYHSLRNSININLPKYLRGLILIKKKQVNEK